MRPLPSSFPFLAPSLSPSISSRPSPAQGSLFSRSFSPSLLPTKVLEKVGDSSRVEGTGERKSERVEEEKESDGVWRRRGRERGEKGVKIPRRSGWNPSILSTNPTDDESAMLYRFSSFDSFFFSFFSFFLDRRSRHLFTTRHAPSSTSPPIGLKIIIARRSGWEGGLEEREVNIWTDLIAGRLKARGTSHPFIELVCRVKPQKAIKSI